MFKRFLFIVGMMAFLCLNVFAQNVKVNGVASKGGTTVRTSSSTTYKLMETYPLCTVTVYQTGTTTLASIFNNEAGTQPKANPFTADQNAAYSFYAIPGRYDIKFSGVGIASPFTITDVFVIVQGSGGSGSGAVNSVFGRTGFVIAQTNDYNWAQVDKTTSSLADLTTRDAGDLSSGILPDVRLSGNIPRLTSPNIFTQTNNFTGKVGIGMSGVPAARLEVADPALNQLRLTNSSVSKSADLDVDTGGSLNILPSGNVIFDTTGNQILPANNYEEQLGTLQKKYLSISAAELNVETLVAQSTIATIGGRIIVAPTNQLIADLAPAATTINVKYNNLTNGETIYMEANLHVEFMKINSASTTITGGYSYIVLRNQDGTGADQWYAGDAMVDTGVFNSGFIDLYSTNGIKQTGTSNGPTIVGNVRGASGTYNDWTETWAIGNLNGLYGYASRQFGVAFGKYTAGVSHITIDDQSGYRIFSGLSKIVGQWTNVGDIIIGQVAANQANVQITAGALTLNANNVPRIQLNSDGSGFLASNNITWNASGATTIAGWTINSNTITSNNSTAAISLGGSPPTSSSTGTGIWLDGTGLYGLSSSVLQTKINSSGIISAGAGAVTLDVNGLSLANGTGPVNLIKWTVAAPAYSPVYMYGQDQGDAGHNGIWSLFVRNSALTQQEAVSFFYSVGAQNRYIFKVTGTGLGTKFGGTTVPTLSTALEVESTTGAFLPPRMSQTQRDALTAIAGMEIFNTSTSKHQGFNGTLWVDFY